MEFKSKNYTFPQLRCEDSHILWNMQKKHTFVGTYPMFGNLNMFPFSHRGVFFIYQCLIISFFYLLLQNN